MLTRLTELDADPQVRAAVDQARQAVAQLHRHPANRRGWPRSAAAAAVRAARASAMADGGSAVLDPAAERIDDPILAGALRVSANLASLATIFDRAPLQALARLHTLAAADLVEADQLGRPSSAALQLAELAGCIAAPGVSGPVLAGAVLAQLLVLRPFGSADGVVARGAARLVGIVTGLDEKGLGVPEVAALRDAGAPGALVGWASGEFSGQSAWLERYCRWLTEGAREGNSIADASLG